MAFKSDKQRRWMHLHHPEIANDWEKKYKKGGFVEDSKEANKAGDVVDAKLSPGELILNGQHLAKVEEMTGVPAEQFWAEVGVPGFEGGQNPMEARGGGVSKKDYLMVGGWDESYPGAWVVDWDFFLKCELAGLKMLRSYHLHFYHFVSIGTETIVEEDNRKQIKERECHEYFKYKWGCYAQHNPQTNSKLIEL